MRRFAAAAICFAVGVALVWSSAPAYPQALKKIRITMPVVALSMMPVYLAKARGFLADEGLDVEMITTNGGGPDIKALIAGDVDFTYTPGDAVVLAYAAGQRTIIVMSGFRRVIINWAMRRDVATARGITESTPFAQKIKALKGLTIGATMPAALTANLAKYVIHEAGYVPQRDVAVIPIGSGQTWLAALENHKVDAALTATPVPEIAVARGYAIMFINNSKGEDPSLPEFLMECLITRPDVIQKNSDLVSRMVRALVKANKWALSSTPEQVADALRPFLGGTPPNILLGGVKSSIPALSPDGRTTARAVQITEDGLQQAGVLEQRVPYPELAVNSFIPK
jgi:NitT/TauT family transport system substrate-binding protein